MMLATVAATSRSLMFSVDLQSSIARQVISSLQGGVARRGVWGGGKPQKTLQSPTDNTKPQQTLQSLNRQYKAPTDNTKTQNIRQSPKTLLYETFKKTGETPKY